MSTRATGQQMQVFLKIQDGGRPPFWKPLNRHISVKNYPISTKFGTLQQMLNPIAVTWPKLKVLKFKIAATAILKVALWSYLIDRLSDFGEILCEEAEPHADKGHIKNRKFLKSKMADGRHFENRFIAISQWKIFRFQWNLLRNIRYWTRLRSRDQKLNFFLNSR